MRVGWSGRPTSSAHMRVGSVSNRGSSTLAGLEHRQRCRAPVPRPGPTPPSNPKRPYESTEPRRDRPHVDGIRADALSASGLLPRRAPGRLNIDVRDSGSTPLQSLLAATPRPRTSDHATHTKSLTDPGRVQASRLRLPDRDQELERAPVSDNGGVNVTAHLHWQSGAGVQAVVQIHSSTRDLGERECGPP